MVPRPGTALKRAFGSLMMSVSPECLCNERAKLMDIMGCRWCRDNLSYVVDWLEEEYRERERQFDELLKQQAKTPQFDSEKLKEIECKIAKLGIVRRVLGKWIKIPFNRMAADKLVRLVIRRAEKGKA